MDADGDRCHCGRPLHYATPELRAQVERMIAIVGDPYVTVTHLETGRKFRVQRHFIALHGLTGWQLLTSGFEEVPAQPAPPAAVVPVGGRGTEGPTRD